MHCTVLYIYLVRFLLKKETTKIQIKKAAKIYLIYFRTLSHRIASYHIKSNEFKCLPTYLLTYLPTYPIPSSTTTSLALAYLTYSQPPLLSSPLSSPLVNSQQPTPYLYLTLLKPACISYVK